MGVRGKVRRAPISALVLRLREAIPNRQPLSHVVERYFAVEEPRVSCTELHRVVLMLMGPGPGCLSVLIRPK